MNICLDFFKCACLKKAARHIRNSTGPNRWATKEIYNLKQSNLFVSNDIYICIFFLLRLRNLVSEAIIINWFIIYLVMLRNINLYIWNTKESYESSIIKLCDFQNQVVGLSFINSWNSELKPVWLNVICRTPWYIMLWVHIYLCMHEIFFYGYIVVNVWMKVSLFKSFISLMRCCYAAGRIQGFLSLVLCAWELFKWISNRTFSADNRWNLILDEHHSICIRRVSPLNVVHLIPFWLFWAEMKSTEGQDQTSVLLSVLKCS